jgi:DNA-binding transcriptional ArsR family regulator
MVNHMVEYSRSHLDAIFHALSDPTRRSMISALGSANRTVGELAAPFTISLAAASKHVKVLEQAGLIARTVTGRMHVCSLNPERLAAADRWLREYEDLWNQRFDKIEGLFAESQAEGT